MELKFFADQSSLTLSILTLPGTHVDKLVQGIAAFLAHFAILAQCAKKQKVWLEAHRWPLLSTQLADMLAILSPRPVAVEG